MGTSAVTFVLSYGCANPMYRVAMTTKYRTVVPNICGSLAWYLLHVISITGPTGSSVAVSLLQLTARTRVTHLFACVTHLFAYHHKVLYVHQLVYFVCVMSAGSTLTLLAAI
jgi:hypothetical protein